MKHLRHVLRPSQWFGSSRTRKRKQDKRRSLRSETLEKRQLLAGDLLASDILSIQETTSQFLASQNQMHNGANGNDTNGDGFISALDAIIVINHLAEPPSLAQGESEVAQFMVDVDGNEKVTPLDAILVINEIAEHGVQRVDELFEPVITIRNLDGTDLVEDANGTVTVDPDQIFEIEIGYNDLRSDPIGLFGYFVDIGLDAPDVLELVTFEAQNIRLPDTTQLESFDSDADGGQATNRTFTISQEGNPTPFVTREFTSRNDVIGSLDNELEAALMQFGFEADDFTIVRTNRNGVLTNAIRYRDFDLANQDVPNITVVSNASTQVDIQIAEVDAVMDTNSAVGAASLTASIDTRSRAFDDNDNYYNIQDPNIAYDPSTGFERVGGITSTPSFDGGIPAQTNDFDILPSPFDSFSFFASLPSTTPADGLALNITVNFDDDSNVAYDVSTALVEDDFLLSDNSNVTILVSTDGGTPPMLNGSTLNPSFLETAGVVNVDLGSIVTEADGDPLTFAVTDTTFTVNSQTTGLTNVATVNNNIVTLDTSAYEALNTGESVTIGYTYSVTDVDGTLNNVMATITVNGVGTADTPPVVSGPVSALFNEDQAGTLSVNLLTNVTDDMGVAGLSVVAGSVTLDSLTGTTDATGITIDEPNNQLNVTPQTYDSLNAGESVVATYNYQVTDGVNDPVDHSVTVTIEGRDEIVVVTPIALDPTPLVFAGITEDSAGTPMFDLLTGATGGDATLSAGPATLVSGNTTGVSVVGNTATVTPSSYNALPGGQIETVVYTYNVTDGNQNAPQTISISIGGVNDAPTVGNPLSFTFNESDAGSMQNLLAGAADPDTGETATLTVTNVTTSGDALGVSVVGNTLQINPGANAALNDNQSATFTVNFQVSDGTVGTAQSATVTINGETGQQANRAPTVSAIDQQFDDNDAFTTIDLNDFADDLDDDTLTFALTSTTGTALGTAFNAAAGTITVNPSANTGLLVGESRTITYSYTVSDGIAAAVPNTALITINGTGVVQANRPPTVDAPLTLTTNEDTPRTLNLLRGAQDLDNDTLTVAIDDVTGDQSGITINDSSVTINSNAYSALNTGESTVVLIEYTISDGNGGSVAQTATITITGITDDVGGDRTIAGSLYIDHIENFDEFVAGAAPVRNGVQDPDESGLSGILVTLTNASGTSLSTVTDLSGAYSFTGLAAGEYTISYDVPSSVIFLGSTSGSFNTEDASAAVPGLNAIGLDGGLASLDILVSSYLSSNQSMSASSDGGLQGGTVALDGDSGNQELFVAGLGLSGVRFAEIALNANRDAALLTVIEDSGSVRTARLSGDQFVVSNDGTAVQFFGGMEDFDFSTSAEDLVTQEFVTFRNAIDQILAQGGV